MTRAAVLQADHRDPTPYGYASGDDLLKLIAYAPLTERWLVRRRVAAYKAATEQDRVHDAAGQSFFADPPQVSRAAAALLKHCDPR